MQKLIMMVPVSHGGHDSIELTGEGSVFLFSIAFTVVYIH